MVNYTIYDGNLSIWRVILYHLLLNTSWVSYYNHYELPFRSHVLFSILYFFSLISFMYYFTFSKFQVYQSHFTICYFTFHYIIFNYIIFRYITSLPPKIQISWKIFGFSYYWSLIHNYILNITIRWVFKLHRIICLLIKNLYTITVLSSSFMDSDHYIIIWLFWIGYSLGFTPSTYIIWVWLLFWIYIIPYMATLWFYAIYIYLWLLTGFTPFIHIDNTWFTSRFYVLLTTHGLTLWFFTSYIFN